MLSASQVMMHVHQPAMPQIRVLDSREPFLSANRSMLALGLRSSPSRNVALSTRMSFSSCVPSLGIRSQSAWKPKRAKGEAGSWGPLR